jgi:hypothetical protein
MPLELKILKDYTNFEKGTYTLNLRKVHYQMPGEGRLLKC